MCTVVGVVGGTVVGVVCGAMQDGGTLVEQARAWVGGGGGLLLGVG